MSNVPGRPAGPQRPAPLNLEIPPELEAVYSNFAVITHSPSEFVVDFAQVLPNAPRHRVQARVVLTALNAKLLLRALGENVAKFEAQYGEITLPEGGSLAETLFRPRPGE
jgi:hypothetical protein